ncbi:MAG: hypothetical protein M3N41_01220 [Acidobacteriota bacterium]|nr:hypothetical protein [Acidobacteriota bacterium]
MNAKQLERASYMAAHAILAANTSAPYLATPGARRTYTVDTIAEKIMSVFELHCSALDDPAAVARPRTEAAPQKLQLVVQELR